MSLDICVLSILNNTNCCNQHWQLITQYRPAWTVCSQHSDYQGKSSDISPDERESIPTVEEFGVRSKEIADGLARCESVVEFVGAEVDLGVSREDTRRRIKRRLVN